MGLYIGNTQIPGIKISGSGVSGWTDNSDKFSTEGDITISYAMYNQDLGKELILGKVTSSDWTLYVSQCPPIYPAGDQPWFMYMNNGCLVDYLLYDENEQFNGYDASTEPPADGYDFICYYNC